MIEKFSETLLAWFDQHGRKDLPWQHDEDPYRIWLSEIMLQQTQVKTVIPYFERFCERFPTVERLASASEDEVLHLWSGLGYYARARNLQHAARQVVSEFGGEFPQEQEALVSLKGIGRSTAAAIRAQAFGQPAAILDGNVKRVLARLFAVEDWPGSRAVETELWTISESLLPKSRLRDYTQAIMDLGATLCTRSNPSCERCPFQSTCLAYEKGLVDQLPARKPKKTSPIRETTFLLILNDKEEILLEKRPAAGIWGGLWSFPETDENRADEYLLKLSLSAHRSSKLEIGEHVFSHFRLRYQPLLIEVEASNAGVAQEEGTHIWYSMAAPPELGLAAPVAKLIKRIQHFQNELL